MPLPVDAIRESEGGVLISVRVVPRARRDAVDGIHAGAIKIRLAAPPVEGRANAALLRFLSRKLGVSRGALEMRAGRSSRHKLVWVEGLTQDIVERALRLRHEIRDDPG